MIREKNIATICSYFNVKLKNKNKTVNWELIWLKYQITKLNHVCKTQDVLT